MARCPPAARQSPSLWPRGPALLPLSPFWASLTLRFAQAPFPRHMNSPPQTEYLGPSPCSIMFSRGSLPPAPIQSQVLHSVSTRCSPPGVKTRSWTQQGHLNFLRCFHDPPGAPVPQISRLQPIYPIRPRRRGSAVTHRRAGGWGAGMRSLPHSAHLPGTAGAQPGRASGGCFLSPRRRRAPTAPSARAPTATSPTNGISDRVEP